MLMAKKSTQAKVWSSQIRRKTKKISTGRI